MAIWPVCHVRYATFSPSLANKKRERESFVGNRPVWRLDLCGKWGLQHFTFSGKTKKEEGERKKQRNKQTKGKKKEKLCGR